jgi:hypothetical protein
VSYSNDGQDLWGDSAAKECSFGTQECPNEHLSSVRSPVTAGQVGRLAVRQSQLRGTCLVIGLNGDAVRPDSQFEGLKPRSPAAALAEGRWRDVPRHVLVDAAQIRPTPGWSTSDRQASTGATAARRTRRHLRRPRRRRRCRQAAQSPPTPGRRHRDGPSNAQASRSGRLSRLSAATMSAMESTSARESDTRCGQRRITGWATRWSPEPRLQIGERPGGQCLQPAFRPMRGHRTVMAAA